jgi:hypothetical protein
MSRGMGWIERTVLEIFAVEPGPLSTFELAARLFDEAPVDSDGLRLLDRAQLVSVRRALLSLAKKGHLAGRRGYRDGQRWAPAATWAAEDAETAQRVAEINRLWTAAEGWRG